MSPLIGADVNLFKLLTVALQRFQLLYSGDMKSDVEIIFIIQILSIVNFYPRIL